MGPTTKLNLRGLHTKFAAKPLLIVLRLNLQEKLFYAWLRIYELRNLVAAKRILVQRRKQKMKLPRILRPQLRLLSQWEPHAKKHVEAVATLVRLLGAAAFSLPLVEGAEVREALLSQLECVEHESSAFPVQANSVSLRRCLRSSTEAMTDIAATAGVFYAKVRFMLSTMGGSTAHLFLSPSFLCLGGSGRRHRRDAVRVGGNNTTGNTRVGGTAGDV